LQKDHDLLTFTHSKPPSLFALLIGINQYISDKLEDLEGAEPDAQAIKAYLETSLGVPTSQIKTLFNEKATREAIIVGLRDLKQDPRINRGDPILIYYAGHGSAAEAPAGWETEDNEIQLLISHDALCESGGKTVAGIPDRTIGVLLEQIAQEKDDNIVCLLR
jgi:Caspase domain